MICSVYDGQLWEYTRTHKYKCVHERKLKGKGLRTFPVSANLFSVYYLYSEAHLMYAQASICASHTPTRGGSVCGEL